MKKFFIFIAFAVFTIMSCKNIQPFTYDVFQQNYFDSNYFKLNKLDTNNINRVLYQNIFDRIGFDTSAKCLLLNVYSVVSNEYGLYDYKTGEYFYSSFEKSKLYHFYKMNTEISRDMYNLIKKFVEGKEQPLALIHKKNDMFDGPSITLSFIHVNREKEVLVKSYYW